MDPRYCAPSTYEQAATCHRRENRTTRALPPPEPHRTSPSTNFILRGSQIQESLEGFTLCSTCGTSFKRDEKIDAIQSTIQLYEIPTVEMCETNQQTLNRPGDRQLEDEDKDTEDEQCDSCAMKARDTLAFDHDTDGSNDDNQCHSPAWEAASPYDSFCDTPSSQLREIITHPDRTITQQEYDEVVHNPWAQDEDYVNLHTDFTVHADKKVCKRNYRVSNRQRGGRAAAT
jgi:hypothetical protein